MRWILARSWLSSVMLSSLVLSLSGCLAPPILFPRTGAHGVIMDQYDNPVPNAKLQAVWWPVRFFYMFADTGDKYFQSGKDGSWRYYTRKVEELHIELIPQDGYERQPDAYMVSLYNGQCPTNDVILRLRKIEPSPPSKETK